MLALRMIIASVELRRWHHGDLQPASLSVDQQVRSDPSPAPAAAEAAAGRPVAKHRLV